MDLVIPKKDLLRLVTRCQGVADKKSAMPALANVLIVAESTTSLLGARAGTIRAAATDLYLGVHGECPADVTTPGSVAVPAKDMLERVKAMPDGPVQIISGEGAQMTLKAVGSPRRYTLHGIPGSEFPQLPKPAVDAPTFELPVDTLALLIARTHFSISTDETRANVNSALLEWAGSQVRMVSTDGHRLSKQEVTIADATGHATMLIPLKAINELRRLADEAKSEKNATVVKVIHSGPSAFFWISNMWFSVKLVDAQFPAYQQVLPKMPPHGLRAPRTRLRDALKAVALAASDRTGGVKLALSRDVLRITSESPESGNGFDELSVDYTGPEIMAGFNVKYFIDVLDAMTDEEVLIGIAGELDPALIQPGSTSDLASYDACVMPIRI